jgi:hypothetical protein
LLAPSISSLPLILLPYPQNEKIYLKIGRGIAGLTVALSLSNIDIPSTIYELHATPSVSVEP